MTHHKSSARNEKRVNKIVVLIGYVLNCFNFMLLMTSVGIIGLGKLMVYFSILQSKGFYIDLRTDIQEEGRFSGKHQHIFKCRMLEF